METLQFVPLPDIKDDNINQKWWTILSILYRGRKAIMIFIDSLDYIQDQHLYYEIKMYHSRH